MRRQMRDSFYNRPGQQKKDDFSNGAGQQKRNEFSKGRAGLGYKKRIRIILPVSPSLHNKDEIFKPSPPDKRIIMSLT